MFEQYIDNFKNIYEAIPNGKVFRLTFDNITGQMKLISRNRDAFEEIRESFAVDNQQAFFTRQYGYAPEAKKYAINKFGFFKSGLVFEILNWIKLHYGDLSFLAISGNCIKYINEQLKPLKSLNTEKIEIKNISEDSGRNAELVKEGRNPYTFRDYQMKSIEAWLKKGYGRGLIEVPTGSGKSFIISNFIYTYQSCIDKKSKFLILVPNTQLVEQFRKDLLDYGFKSTDLAKFTGAMKKKEREQNDINKASIIISNRQYIFKNKSYLPKIDVLIVDEAHQATADSSYEFISNLDCKIKVGCSGTLPKDKFYLWKLQGVFCNVLYKENVTDLQNRGFISKLKITLLDIFHKGVENNRNYLFHTNSYMKYHEDDQTNGILFGDAYNAEQEFYQKQYEQLYTPVLKYLNTLDENIIVLFDRIETGKNVFDLTKQLVSRKKAYYIDGQTEIEVREEVRKKFEASGDNILIGNVSILGTGINIKRLKHIVFICSTKSFSRIIQSIGRALRLHETKNEAHLVDVVYNFKYSQKHFSERMKYYREIYNKKKPDEIIRIEI